MYTITVSVDSLTREGVQVIHDNLLKTFAEMGCNDFCIEIAEQSVKEVMEEAEQISEKEIQAEIEGLCREFYEEEDKKPYPQEIRTPGDFWVHVS